MSAPSLALRAKGARTRDLQSYEEKLKKARKTMKNMYIFIFFDFREVFLRKMQAEYCSENKKGPPEW